MTTMVIKIWWRNQCVTIPKIWMNTKPKLFSYTKFFRYRIRYLFQNNNKFDSESNTFFETKFCQYWIRNHLEKGKVLKPRSFETAKFWNREVSKPKRHTLQLMNIEHVPQMWSFTIEYGYLRVLCLNVCESHIRAFFTSNPPACQNGGRAGGYQSWQ